MALSTGQHTLGLLCISHTPSCKAISVLPTPQMPAEALNHSFSPHHSLPRTSCLSIACKAILGCRTRHHCSHGLQTCSNPRCRTEDQQNMSDLQIQPQECVYHPGHVCRMSMLEFPPKLGLLGYFLLFHLSLHTTLLFKEYTCYSFFS